MKQFLLIFALLIASCDVDNPIPSKSVAIQISDANPVQFWPIECETYNEKEVCGIHSKCWCHPWQCDDEILTQFTDTDPFEEYSLGIYTDDEGLVNSIPFVKTDKFFTDTDQQFENNEFAVSLTNWGNYSGSPGSSAGWTWDASGALADGTSGSLAQTYELEQERMNLGIGNFDKYPPGDYVFKLMIINQSTGGSSPLQEGLNIRATNTLGVFEDLSPTITVVRGGGLTEYTVPFTLTEARKYLTVQLYKQGPSGGSIIKIYLRSFIIDSSPLDYTLSVFNNSFIPEEEDICDQQIQLKIESDLSSPSEVLKSDCLDIRTEHKCTTLIEYSNNRNFAGLIYQDVSPEQTFQIRVPAIFFHNQFPEEDEAIELTTGITKTSGTLKVQRLFDTDYMPYYMHQKLMLIFKHQTINIDALSWIKEDKYEIQEGNRMWPVKKAKVFLTENYIQRAVL